ncbi:MAG TPA: CvpA family protein [Phycisphaerae bacterium]|nr:CvpA family protein [Phycisphaerae bacterium]
MYLLRGQKKPPVIAEKRAFSPPAGPSTPSRGRETDFSIDRDEPVKGPWLMAGLLLTATAGAFGLSLENDYLLGQIAAPVVGLLSLHGLVKGGFRKAIMLPITIAVVGFLAANPTFFDPIVQRVTGGPSALGNYVACAGAVTLLLWIVGMPLKSIRKKVIMKRPVLRGTDRFTGTGIGFVEGAFIALVVMWSAALVEPQAKSIAANQSASSGQRYVANGVLTLLSEVDASPLQPIVRDANLLKEFPQLTKTLEAIQADGSVDPTKLDPKQVEGLIEMLESLGGEEGGQMAEQLRTIEKNQKAEAEAIQKLPRPSN